MRQGENKLIQIDLSETIVIAIITSIAGIVGWGLKMIWDSIKDTRNIKGIGANVESVKTEITSARCQELKSIDTHTTEIHKNMLSEVIPGMKKLDRLDSFVSEININTKNSGGDVRLIIAEVNKIVLNVESLQKELDSVKKESQKREKEYMEQIAELRLENSQLKQRNRELEQFQGRRSRNQDLER